MANDKYQMENMKFKFQISNAEAGGKLWALRASARRLCHLIFDI
jgi:hypothetical protein